ncbi:hypothetical protein [Mycobacterium sp. OTB74]|jgi:hypothetical protein|uniref:hypothetical protein n=1 Tax=Mycobacterium sp. OTB74 TaxID=1853452 RepID=UPI0024767E32|nr:hypothetical protein [Mycobacterium sp. OTB74]MDH6247133.1 hypothetical protein [Mycobacterium sp. OTB74]
MKTKARIAATTALLAASFGLTGLAAATTAQAMPAAPMPGYHWCPGDFWAPEWGFNWAGDRCHDDFYFDGEPRDQWHWHGQGPWHPGW